MCECALKSHSKGTKHVQLMTMKHCIKCMWCISQH